MVTRTLGIIRERLHVARIKVRRVWRRMRDRCELCNDPRSQTNWSDVHTLGPFCRRCNKGFAFSQMYGMSRERTLQALSVGRALERANARNTDKNR